MFDRSFRLILTIVLIAEIVELNRAWIAHRGDSALALLDKVRDGSSGIALLSCDWSGYSVIPPTIHKLSIIRNAQSKVAGVS